VATSASPETILEVDGLEKRFGGVRAVSGVSFDIRRGEIVSLVGPNGAGKTTVFNIVSGALAPDSGRVVLEGQPITGLAPYQVARRGVSRTFQDMRLFLGMTVLENVLVAVQTRAAERPWATFAAPRQSRARESADRGAAREALQRVGLLERQDAPASNLSFGQQKRLMMARAFAMRADLWLLDEPAAGLDAAHVREMMAFVRSLADLGKTVCLVEHNIGVVRHVSNRVLFMSEGALLAQGTPDEIFGSAELRAIYLGTA
jgi:ABC-type branched-subunit amino acid transport system ATPase component